MIQALSNLNLELRTGDRMALVGHNGAGKTTLLRVIAGIYEPVTGHVSKRGRIAPLFDVGLCMDPETTGYDNIYLRGLLLGLNRRQIYSRIDEIADFSELGTFLDMPIRTYSTGMQARLAFAISTSIEPDILLLDEGIAAGDAAFLTKANKRMHELVDKAGILVFASHSEEHLQRFCNKAVLLERGRVRNEGRLEEILSEYQTITAV
jgi:ABC-2 type transport system ATP-binding protein